MWGERGIVYSRFSLNPLLGFLENRDRNFSEIWDRKFIKRKSGFSQKEPTFLFRKNSTRNRLAISQQTCYQPTDLLSAKQANRLAISQRNQPNKQDLLSAHRLAISKQFCYQPNKQICYQPNKQTDLLSAKQANRLAISQTSKQTCDAIILSGISGLSVDSSLYLFFLCLFFLPSPVALSFL